MGDAGIWIREMQAVHKKLDSVWEAGPDQGSRGAQEQPFTKVGEIKNSWIS